VTIDSVCRSGPLDEGPCEAWCAETGYPCLTDSDRCNGLCVYTFPYFWYAGRGPRARLAAVRAGLEPAPYDVWSRADRPGPTAVAAEAMSRILIDLTEVRKRVEAMDFAAVVSVLDGRHISRLLLAMETGTVYVVCNREGDESVNDLEAILLVHAKIVTTHAGELRHVYALTPEGLAVASLVTVPRSPS
jgi:hypothetical protein